jgi:NAD(P) transhydrogenase subunit alpha
MIIAAMHEAGLETRVAITPTAVKHYIKLGYKVVVEHHAGQLAGFSDQEYELAGATISHNRPSLLRQANVVVCVNEPKPNQLLDLSPHALLISPIDSDLPSTLLDWCCEQRISVFSMNHVPRISRAQNIDSLSSQANLAGYRAVIEAVAHFHRAVPMMMTAAGMIHPAKMLILGAGVAGLQAIATAKRLGAVVYAFDVRAAAKEQVQSLNAEFIEVTHEQDAETVGGYAKEVSEEYRLLQAELIDKYACLADIVICTALIPGKKAPILLTKKTVEHMKPGAIVVDLATARGGNCELSVRDKIVQHGQVTLIGYSNIVGLIPATASELYANNVVNLLQLLTITPSTSTSQLNFNPDDEIIRQAMLCHNGQHRPFQSIEEPHHG